MSAVHADTLQGRIKVGATFFPFDRRNLTGTGQDDTVLKWFTWFMSSRDVPVSGEELEVHPVLLARPDDVEATAVPTSFGTSRTVNRDEANFTARWLALQEAVEQGDTQAFKELVQQIDWKRRSAHEWQQAVRMALAVGAPLLARELATKGARAHPDAPELAKMARILAPPRLLGTRPANPSVGANIRWMREHAARHRGQWVAVRNGELVATGASLAELLAKVPDRENTLFARA